MNSTFTNGIASPKTVDLEEMLRVMSQSQPPEWLLIAPNGNVYSVSQQVAESLRALGGLS